MKEFKFYSDGFELPVSVCETQKEAVYEITSAREALKLLDKEGECGCEKLIIDVIYKDGSTYYNSNNYAEEGKFKRTGIARAMVSTEYGTVVFGDFAITEYGDVSIDESDIEEYGVYAGQYDVKEQEAQEVQETVEQTEVEETAENAMESAEVKTNSELHLDEEIVKAFEKQKSSFKFYGVDMAYQVERYVNCGSLKYVQLGTYSDYSKAVQAAYEAIKEWGEENIYFHTVEIAKRNSKTAKDKYDREILKSEKKEIGYYWYASRFTDSKECVYISIDSPIRIPIETAQKSEMEEVKGTAEIETAKTDDSGFEYYSVETAYEVTVCEEPTIVFKNYSNALEMAKRNADKYGVMNVFMQAVNFITRNGKQPESDHDKEILADETDQIEARCVWYDYKDLKGFVNTEDAIYMPLHGVGYTRSQAQTVIITATNNARARYRRMHDIHSPMDLKKFSKKRLDDYLSKELDYINKSLNDTLPKEVFNAMKGEIMYA